MTSPARIIDAHAHVFWHGGDDAALVADLDEQGIDKALLLTWTLGETEGDVGFDRSFNPVHAEPGSNHPGLPLSDVIRAARRYPDRFIVGYAPHPLEPNAAKRLEAAIEMYDIRAYGEWKCRLHLDDPRCIELFRLAGRHGLPVVLHIDIPYMPDAKTGQMKYYQEWYGGTIDNLERAIQACPETTFIGHSPGFWREISGDADAAADLYPAGAVTKGGRLQRLMDNYPTLFADMSGHSGLNALDRDPAHGKEFLLKYHERLLFGRDIYGGELHEFLQSLDLPEDVTENIYHRNSERLFRI